MGIMVRGLGGLLTIGFVASSAVAADRMYEKSFAVDSGARFQLDSHKGNIRLRTHGKAVIQVSARIYADGDDADAQLVDRIEIRERASRSSVSLEVDFDQPSRGGGWFGSSWSMPLVDWDILVPDDIDLNLDSHKSTFDVEVPSGRVTIDSHKGTGAIRGVRSDFSLDTHKGQFEIDVLELHDFEVDTHKGTIVATFHRASDVAIRAESHKGDLRFRGREVPVQREDGELMVDYREGSGQNRIDLETHKGSIELRFE